MLLELPFDDLVTHCLRLACQNIAGEKLLLLGVVHLSWDVVHCSIAWVHRSNLHGNLMCKFLKLRQASYKICLTVDLDHHTDPTTVDIALDQPFTGLAVALFLRLGQALLAQGIER